MATGDKLFLADKQTLDAVNTKIGAMNDVATTTSGANNASTGNIFKRLYYLVYRLGDYNAAGSSSGTTLFSRINYMINWLTSARGTKIDSIGVTTDSGATVTTGTIMGKVNEIMAQNNAALLDSPIAVPHEFSPFTFSDQYSCSIIIDKFVARFSGKHTINISMNVASTTPSPNAQIELLSWNSIIAQNAYRPSDTLSTFTRGMDFYMGRPIGFSINRASLSLPYIKDIENSGQQTITFDIYCKAGEPYILTMDCYGESSSYSVGATISAITITAG